MRKLFLTLAILLFMAVIASAPPVMAAGTVAGTAISNQAYGDYKDANGSSMTRVFSNTVTMTVSQVYAVSIVPTTITSSAKNGDIIYYLVQLFNNGNGNDTQTFSYAVTSGWIPSSVRMFYDVNNNHVYDAGDILLTQTAPNTFKTVTTGGTPVLISPDDDYDVLMEVTVPDIGTAPTGSSNQITITTTSDGSVGSSGGTKTATGTYTTTVLAASITAAKTHSPAGSPTYLKPGDVVTYTITLTNSGTADATGLTVTDPLPANVTYNPGTLRININGAGFVAKTDAADNDGVKYDAGTRSVIAADGATVLNIPIGQSWAVEFKATLNAGTPSGSAVVNQASIQYTSGTSTVTIQTNGDTCLVTTTNAIDLNSTAAPQTVNPSDQVVYPFTATNNGNANDIINITGITSTQGWTWAIWADSNGDGIPGNDGDYLLTDTNGDGMIDTNTLALNGGTIHLLAVATVPAGTANGTTDTVTISAASANDPTKTDSQAFATTIKAPILSMVKAITHVQDPGSGPVCNPTNPANGSPCIIVPGSVITYLVTATNSGNGNATVVVLTDLIPNFTTYKTGTIRTGSSSGTLTVRTDAVDGDGAEFNTGSNAVVVPDGSTLTLGPSGTWVFEFQVTVN
jgi:uncharacterized repeat protein (TIGR01451 family)